MKAGLAQLRAQPQAKVGPEGREIHRRRRSKHLAGPRQARAVEDVKYGERAPVRIRKHSCSPARAAERETDFVNGSYLDEIAEHRKQCFLRLVERLARLRDVQYDCDQTEHILAHAKTIVARNLPSNLLRGAAIVVDWRHGFPPDWSSFHPPEWVEARQLLPEGERGSLICSNFKDIACLEAGDAVVLTQDLPSKGLLAGMAGIVRDILSADAEKGTPELLLVEFGEPQECVTKEIELPVDVLRTPRPGDLLENFHS